MLIVDKVYEYVVALSVGYNDTNPCLLHLLGCGVFRVHAPTPKGTLLRLYILRQVAPWGYLADKLCSRGIRMGGIDAVYVRLQDERIGLHHLGNEPRELIVIGKHQLGN